MIGNKIVGVTTRFEYIYVTGNCGKNIIHSTSNAATICFLWIVVGVGSLVSRTGINCYEFMNGLSCDMFVTLLS